MSGGSTRRKTVTKTKNMSNKSSTGAGLYPSDEEDLQEVIEERRQRRILKLQEKLGRQAKFINQGKRYTIHFSTLTIFNIDDTYMSESEEEEDDHKSFGDSSITIQNDRSKETIDPNLIPTVSSDTSSSFHSSTGAPELSSPEKVNQPSKDFASSKPIPILKAV
jgi:hypothetical protein